MRDFSYDVAQSPREWGRAHGAAFRGEIKALSEVRTYLCTRVGGFPTRALALAAAAAHVPLLRDYDQALYEELLGVAEGADVTPAEVVIANHYTDLRDLSANPHEWKLAPEWSGLHNADYERLRADAQRLFDERLSPSEVVAPMSASASSSNDQSTDPGGCSVVWTKSPIGNLIAQTWDMHATAIPYVMMLRVPRRGDVPGAWLLGLTGTFGLAGMNDAGVAICINNLFSLDATVGVVWPAVVRKALRETTAAAALEVIRSSPIGSGHHYMVADATSEFSLESSGVLRNLVPLSGDHYLHTNHGLTLATEKVSKVPPASTTFDRYRLLQVSLQAEPVVDLGDIWTRLGSQEGWPRSVCTNVSTAENPHGAATCGAIAINLATKEIWAQGGLITNVRADRFYL